MWYVYILESKNRALYTGITTDIKRRIREHRQGRGGRFTRSFGVKRLVYREDCPTRAEALKREAQIKRLVRKEKMALIQGNFKI